MKKLFLLIPALVLSLAINAAVININTGTTDALRVALYNANDGDEIVMAPGTYVESNENFIAFDGKNVLVRAEEGAEVIIQPQVPITVANGGCAHLQNVKIDASRLLELADWYEHVIYATDAAVNNRIILEGCEIYGFALNKSFISCPSASALDALTINNCYFHNINKSCVFIENTSNAIAINITNSTFANITTVEGSYYAGVIDSRATSGSFLVDHCTFYNVEAMSTGYAAIGQVKLTSGATVSNCIFALSAPGASSNRTIRDVVAANNCLVYNYSTDGGYGMQSNVTKTGCFIADPLFVDAANNNFALAGDWTTMSLSPARGAATDGSDLGDPRWYSAETLPETNFTEPYDLVGAKAQIAGNIWYNNTDDYLYYNDKSECGTAKWKLHIGRQSAVTAVIDMEETSASGSIFQIVVLDANGEEVGKVTAPYKDDDADIEIPGMLYFPAEGDYTIKLLNNQSYSSAKLKKITLSYTGGAVQAMPGTTDINEAWFVGGTRADGKITFNSGHVSEGWAKWNVAFASAANYNVTLNVYSNNGKKFTVALQDADGNDVVTPLYKEGGDKHETDPVALEMGAMSVPAGNYILKVTNAEDWSDAKLISVQFVRAGGGLINLPGNLSFDEVILSQRAWIDNDSILFTARGDEGYNSSEWAKWNIHTENGGKYNFTLNAFNAEPATAQRYKLTVLATNELDTIATIMSAWNNTTNEMSAVLPAELAAGNYILKVQNTVWGSKGRVMSIEASYEGGALINLPATLNADDAMFSTKAYAEGGEIYFSPDPSSQNVSGEWAKWNVNVAASGTFLFTLNVTSTNSQTYKITILDGETEIDSFEQHPSSGDQTLKHYFNLATGNYIVKVENTYSWSNGHVVSLVVTAPELLVLYEAATDNTIIHNNYRNGNHDIQIIRTIVPDMYNTICLPFDVSSSQLQAIFGSDVKLLQMASATLNGNDLNLEFEETTSIYRGTPFLIKTSNTVTNPVFADVEIKAEEGAATGGEGFDADFIGSFIAGEVPAGDQNLFLGPSDLLYFSQTATPIKGMRAYFHVKVPGAANIVSRARIVLKTNTTTDIDNISTKAGESVKTIENGQIVIIRDGVRYNVMGSKIQ